MSPNVSSAYGRRPASSGLTGVRLLVLLQIAALVMTGLIALDLLYLAHMLRTPDTTPVSTPTRPVESAPRVDVDTAVHATEPLFGKASPPPAPVARPVAARPAATPIPPPVVPARPALLLTGTALGPRPTAVVSVAGRVRVMRLGDPLGDAAGAWHIARIEDDRVVIQAGAAQHILLLGFQEDETHAQVPVSTPAPTPAPPPPAPAESPVAPPPTSSPSGVVPRQQRDQALRDKKEYERFALLPDEGGYGVRITYLRADAFFARLGLRQDDVLLDINGQTVDMDHSDEVYRTLMHEDHIVIHARRDGKDLTLDIEVR